MFQRKKSSLPTTASPMMLPTGGAGDDVGSTSNAGFSFGGRAPDGSGKAIKMDAPIVKAWKKASGFTKGSYYVLLFFAALIFIGIRYLWSWNASIYLTCHTQECTFEVTPPGGKRMVATFARSQLVSAHAIKTDKAGNFLSFDTSKYEPPSRGKKKKKGSSYKGPDENGEYKSYAIKMLKKPPVVTSENPPGEEEEIVPDSDFTPIMQYLSPGDDEDTYMFYMRKFGFAQSRTRVRTMVSKIESYIRKRRQKLVVKESAQLPWQGIVCLVLGLIGLLFTLLIGQFWDEAPKKHGGPGVRRQYGRGASDSKYVVNTGRPSKFPSGPKKK